MGQLCSMLLDTGVIVSMRKDAANFGNLLLGLAGAELALALGVCFSDHSGTASLHITHDLLHFG